MRKKVSEVTAYVVVTNSGVSITSPAYNGSVTRASIVLQFNHATSVYTQVSSGQDRCQHDVYGNDGQWHLNYRLAGEPQRTNNALGSCDPTGASGYWTNASTLGIAAATNCAIPGATAYVITNVSSTTAALTQVIGTFGASGTVRADRIVVEQGTGTKTALQVYDATATAVLGKIVLTWAGLSIATTGTVTASNPDVLGIGPNGGTMVGFWLMTTSVAASGSTPGGAGNSFRLDFIPSGGVSDTATTIWHHIQDELGLLPSTPIVTGAATATRNAEIVSVPLPVAAQPAQALTGYTKCVDQGLASPGLTTTFSGISGGIPLLQAQSFAGALFTRLNNGTDAAFNSPTQALGGTFGDTVESRHLLLATGALQAGGVKNGGEETLAAASSAPTHGIIVPWGANTVYLGGSVGGGGLALGTFILAAGAPSMAQFRSL